MFPEAVAASEQTQISLCHSVLATSVSSHQQHRQVVEAPAEQWSSSQPSPHAFSNAEIQFRIIKARELI